MVSGEACDRAAHPPQAGDALDHLVDVDAGHRNLSLGQEANVLAGVAGSSHHVHLVDSDGARGGFQESKNLAHEGGLAGALPINREAYLLSQLTAVAVIGIPSAAGTIAFGAWYYDLSLSLSPLVLLVVPLAILSLAGVGVMIAMLSPRSSCPRPSYHGFFAAPPTSCHPRTWRMRSAPPSPASPVPIL